MRLPRTRPGNTLEVPLGPWVEGINEKKEAGTLTATELRAAANVLFDEVPGQTTKCPGSLVAALMPSGTPAKYGYRFIKTDGTELLLVSDGETIYSTEDLVTFTELITGLDDTAYIEFDTAEGRCWITNGSDPVMWYDGTNFVVMDREHSGTTAAGTDQTHIVDATLTEANDYWNLMKVVITSGTYIGMEGTVTDFDAATDKLTISGFDNNPGAGVTYSVGIIIPKGRVVRYDGTSLFMGATSENRSEIRFSRLDDPDTGEKMSLDSPRAWPGNYQLAITQDDGDQVWSFSPKHRDRILVTKATAIYRLDPDPTSIYTPVLVSQEVGCRYHDSWAVKDDMLHFMGNERSGLLDMYVTDMVSVKPRHKDGRLLPSFESMRRAEPIYKYIARASADQFDTGEKSTLCKTDLSRLECRELTSKSDWTDTKVASSNVSLDDNEGAVTIQGIPPWPVRYEANELPAVANPAWTRYSVGPVTEVIDTGKLAITTSNLSTSGAVYYYRNNILSSSQNAFVAVRLKIPTTGKAAPIVQIDVQNGVKKVSLYISGQFGTVSILNSGWHTSMALTDYITFHLILDKNNKACLFINGVKVWSGDAPGIAAAQFFGASSNSISFLSASSSVAPGGQSWWDFLYYDDDFSLTATEISATLPTTGTFSFKLDFTRTLDKFGKMWLTLGAQHSGATATGTDATHIVDSTLTGEDDFWNGRTITILSGALAGETGTVTDYVSSTKTLTISGLSGDPGTPVNYQINRGGSVAIETQSSDDDVTYSALASLNNGQEPAVDNATPLARYLKITLTLTRADVVNGPEVAAMIGGFLWRMKAALVGANIAAWRTFAAEVSEPAGTSLVMQIRLATVTTTPTESDWSAWETITDGDNIGTILSDTPPPAAGTTRWLDVKIEGGPSAAGVTPSVENILLNWQEGSLTRLLLTAMTYKKRYYLTGTDAESEYNNLLFVLDTQQAWTKFINLALNRLIAFRGQIYGLSAVDDKIWQMEVAGKYTHGDTAIDAYVDAGAIDGGHQRFELAGVKVGAGAYSSAIQVLHSYDGTTFTALGTLTFAAEGTQILRAPRGYIGKRHFIRLRNNASQNLAINMVSALVTAMSEDL